MPNVILIAVGIGLVFWFLLDRTRFGVNVKALGGNRQAAIGNGLRVQRIDLTLYVPAALRGSRDHVLGTHRRRAGDGRWDVDDAHGDHRGADRRRRA